MSKNQATWSYGFLSLLSLDSPNFPTFHRVIATILLTVLRKGHAMSKICIDILRYSPDPNQRPSKQITSNTAQNLIFFSVLLASFCILFMRAVCNHHQGVGQTKHPKSFLWLQENIGEALKAGAVTFLKSLLWFSSDQRGT